MGANSQSADECQHEWVRRRDGRRCHKCETVEFGVPAPAERCPFPIDNDDGSIEQCVAHGHCGCVHRVLPQGPGLSGIQDTQDTVAGTGSALPKPASQSAPHGQGVDWVDQEPLDMAAARSLLSIARADVRSLRARLSETATQPCVVVPKEFLEDWAVRIDQVCMQRHNLFDIEAELRAMLAAAPSESERDST